MILLSSLSVIISCTTFSYVVTASEGSFFLGAHLAMQVLDRAGHSHLSSELISEGEGCNKNDMVYIFSKKI